MLTVVTPSFRQVDLLRLCAASIADQSGPVEHIIQDGGSGRDFEEWSRSQTFATCYSESDKGMYDAINRGFLKSKGDIVSWLNCDEQYLPQTVSLVTEFFSKHPEVDILFGDIIVLNR